MYVSQNEPVCEQYFIKYRRLLIYCIPMTVCYLDSIDLELFIIKSEVLTLS